MYARMTEPVPVPVPDKEKKEQMKILKNGYVMWITESKWDSEKKMTIDNRISIGKLVDGQKSMMYPSSRYFSVFSKKEEEPEAEEVATEPELPKRFDTELTYGPYAALKKTLEKIGCMEALNESFPMEALKIVALATHSLISMSSVAQDFPYWYFHNYSGLGKNLDDSEISSLYLAISKNSDGQKEFIRKFLENYKKAMGNPEEVIVALDSTNQGTSSKGNELAEHGHAKKDEGLPIINTALIVDEKTSIPLFYEHYSGSILDKSETSFTVEKAKDLGFEKLFFMMDRGYCAPRALKSFSDMKFAVMASEKYSFVNEEIEKTGKTIAYVEKYYIESQSIYGIALGEKDAVGSKYNVYLYYDDSRAQDERESIHSKIRFLLSEAGKRKRYSENFRKKYSKWLDITPVPDPESGKKYTLRPKHDEIQKAIDKAGFFIIISNSSKSAKDIITIARMRDTDEKCFRRMKSHFDLEKTYVHSKEAYEGKMFVAFIALIMSESFMYFQRSELIKSSHTLSTLLGELSKYKIMIKNDSKWMVKYAMTKKQKSILSHLDLTENDVLSKIKVLDITP